MFEIIVEIILVSAIGISAYSLRMLTLSGVVAAVPIGVITLLAGGPEWFIVLLYFLLLGSFLTKLRKEIRENIVVEEGIRKWTNVVANGFWPTVAAATLVFSSCTYREGLFAFYIGCISTMLADTAATEIGLLVNAKPRLITKLNKVVPPGTSGGVTIYGFIGSFITCISIIFISIPGANIVGFSINKLAAIALVAGFLGSIVDSILGATIQGIYRCPRCGLLTEKRVHCKNKTVKIKGLEFFDNNLVNFISSFIGGLTGIIIYIL